MSATIAKIVIIWYDHPTSIIVLITRGGMRRDEESLRQTHRRNEDIIPIPIFADIIQMLQKSRIATQLLQFAATFRRDIFRDMEEPQWRD